MKGFCLEASGEYACFTRPEMKAERASYDFITPSAARSIFEAILWKPAIRWRVTKIEVLKEIRWTSVRRNEVGGKASKGSGNFFIEDNRTQRATLMLRDVAYRLYAEFDFIPPDKRGRVYNTVPEYLLESDEAELIQIPNDRKDEKAAKYAAMFDRRASKGQCFHHPYLGCREFAADFRLVKDPDSEPVKPISLDKDFGWMLYDLDYSDPKNIHPRFFHAIMEQGVIHVPDWNSPEVKG